MRQRANVSSGADLRLKADLIAFEIENVEFVHLDLDRLEFDVLFFSRQLIGGYARDLLSRKWRWQLLNLAYKLRRGGSQSVEGAQEWFCDSNWLAFRIVSISGKSQTDGALIDLLRGVIELGQ